MTFHFDIGSYSSLSHTHTHSHSHALALTHTRTHSHTHTLTHTRSLFYLHCHQWKSGGGASWMGSNPGPAPTAEPEIFRLKGFRTCLSLGWTSASLHDRRDFGHFRQIEISILLPSTNFIFHRFISGPLVLVCPRLCRLKRRFFDSQGKSLRRQNVTQQDFLLHVVSGGTVHAREEDWKEPYSTSLLSSD